jgi:UDP-N-acetyl-D-mannosaminuronate dehydrogenase
MATAPALTLPALKKKMESREARVGIIGLGYVGLPLALLFSEQKFRVTGFDTDAAKVAKLNDGRSYIVRIQDSAGPEDRICGNRQFRRDCRDGCGDHLRAHPAQ